MKLRIHRGAKEIGGNCIELNAAGKTLLLDLGMPLSVPDSVDVPLPDVKGLVDGNDGNFLGVVLSHPHADHYGLLNKAAQNTRVYLGRDAQRLLVAALPFTSFGLNLPNTVVYSDRETFVVGPFRITPFLADHSAFDAYSLLIEAEGQRLFYTGDFRGHGRKQGAFKRLLADPSIKGVDVMLMEGTHLGRESNTNAQTESSLEDEITQSISNTTGLVLACFSGQNIDRFVTFWKAARRSGRTFVADVYLAHILNALDRPTLPKPPVFLPAKMKSKLMREQNTSVVIPFRRRRIYPEQIAGRINTLVMMFRSSMMKEFEGLKCLEEGKLIYSQWSGYIDRDRVNIKDWCASHNLDFEILHTSGHADTQTLVRLAKVVSAKRVIPIHSYAPGRLSDLIPNSTPVEDGEWINI
jgi:ribonuclease J